MKKKIIMMMLALNVIMSVTACGTEKKAAENRIAAFQKNVERECDKGTEEKVEQLSRKECQIVPSQTELPEGEEEISEFTQRLEQVEVGSRQGKHIQLNVPEGYYWNEGSEENEGGCFFERKDGKETVFVGFWDRLLEVDAEYCDKDLRIPYYATGTESEVMTEEINGRTVYYKHITYEYEEYNGLVSYETVKAMCAVGDDHMLVVETSGLSGEKADFEEIREFFEFQEK